MLGMGVISPFLPEFITEHGANGFWVGMIFAGFGLSRGIIMPIVGNISDRTGRKLFVEAGLLLFAVVSLLYPFCANVFQLTVVRMAHGLAAGLIMPIVMAYVGEISESGKEGVTTGTLNMMFFLGLGAGPILGGVIAQFHGFNMVFYSISALAFINLLVVLFFLPELGKAETADNRKPYDFSMLIKFHYIKAVLIIAVLGTLLVAVFMSFMPSIAVRDNLDPTHVGLIISVAIFIAGILQMPVGLVTDKLDRMGKLLQISLGVTIGMLSVFVIPFCPDFKALLVSGIFVGLGSAVATPALTALSVEIGHKTGMGTWMGIFTAAKSLGFVITPLLAGIIMDHIGINSVFYLFGLLTLYGLALSWHYFYLRIVKGYKTAG